jgi:hypothetical protein
MAKQCGTCTKCCDGSTVGGLIYGHGFGNKKPCYFLDISNKNCSIYADRPEHPCKSYQCMWLKYEDVPLWMKPENSNVTVTAEDYNGNKFLTLNAQTNDYSSKVLSYVINYAEKNNMNLIYDLTFGGPWILKGNKEQLADYIFNSKSFEHMPLNFTHNTETI